MNSTRTKKRLINLKTNDIGYIKNNSADIAMSLGNITGFNIENEIKPSGKRAEAALFVF
jgi:hypothetical protein